MNKLFYYEITEKINGEETYPLKWCYSGRIYHYGEPYVDNIITRVITDFNVLYNSDMRMLYADRDKTIFRHRPKIIYATPKCYFKSVTEKNFKEYSILTEVKEVTRRMTMEELMQELSAEEFALWCKDHGLSTCPMNK